MKIKNKRPGLTRKKTPFVVGAFVNLSFGVSPEPSFPELVLPKLKRIFFVLKNAAESIR